LTLSSSLEEQDKKDGLLGENLERVDDFLLIEKRVIERSLNAHRGDRKAVAKVMGDKPFLFK
jgi:transcriptional regulator with PAS, ATPase and Fis domain